jgi:tRNA U34 2-thiouridine synthase MnmA/TrmU
MNPCLDCKVFMVKKALQWAEAHGFDFIITGEVVGQRPMSQRAETMPIVANESGAMDRLLRPLSAVNLPATLPEREGWIDRNKLYGFSGRGRKPQMALAEQFGFVDYAAPAGGCCFLTDEAYSKKLVDLWQSRGSRDYEMDDIMLLKVGRHIRPNERMKLIVSREEGENNFMNGYRKIYTHLFSTSHHGPLALIDGCPTAEDLKLAARIVARYGKGRTDEEVIVEIHPLDGEPLHLKVAPLSPVELDESWMV